MKNSTASLDVLLGLQWGDEGKGKVVDVLARRYNAVMRFQGGPNAGHSLEFGGHKHVLRSIPSGVFRDGVYNLVGGGVVIDPVSFHAEAMELESAGVNLPEVLKIARRAHLILPTHKLLDAALERQRGEQKIGSTRKGIGPTYTDKIAREGLRVGDLEKDNFMEIYRDRAERHLSQLRCLGAETEDIAKLEAEWFEGIETLREHEFVDAEYEVNRLLDDGCAILAEGAQGTLLDIDFGTYPFVTSSSTVCAGACDGLGVSPRRIGDVYGIFKAYCTRVGQGPFPTELFDEIGRKIQKQGNEFGAVTGRPRRCGWLDLTALRYAVMINGVTKLIMTKADVLTGFDVVKIATGYSRRGQTFAQVPYEFTDDLVPQYTEFPGWHDDLTGVSRYDDLPSTLKNVIEFIESNVGVPVVIVSVGPDRAQTIER